MKAIYAYPDHEVVSELLPAVTRRHMATPDALEHIRANPGLVPVAIDHTDGGKVLWADIGDYPYREWQFLYTVQQLASDDRITDAFTTDIDILATDDVLNNPVAPVGFIFHISRCGSTLTGKAIARLDSNIVVNQGGPLQRGLWAWLTDDFTRPLEATPENLAVFRRVVLAMTRRRAPGQNAAFLKFISWNTLYMDFARKAFPGVPSLFLYRDPVEVIASVMKETTAALVAKDLDEGKFLIGRNDLYPRSLSNTEFLAHCYAHYFRVALESEGDDVTHVNYIHINPGNFPVMLREGLGLSPSKDELDTMLEQFKFHSKDDTDSAKFKDDSAEKQAALSPEERDVITTACGPLMEQLDNSPHNLFANAYTPRVSRTA